MFIEEKENVWMVLINFSLIAKNLQSTEYISVKYPEYVSKGYHGYLTNAICSIDWYRYPGNIYKRPGVLLADTYMSSLWGPQRGRDNKQNI